MQFLSIQKQLLKFLNIKTDTKAYSVCTNTNILWGEKNVLIPQHRMPDRQPVFSDVCERERDALTALHLCLWHQQIYQLDP